MRNYMRYEAYDVPVTPLHYDERGGECRAEDDHGWICTVHGPHTVHEASQGTFICASWED